MLLDRLGHLIITVLLLRVVLLLSQILDQSVAFLEQLLNQYLDLLVKLSTNCVLTLLLFSLDFIINYLGHAVNDPLEIHQVQIHYHLS